MKKQRPKLSLDDYVPQKGFDEKPVSVNADAEPYKRVTITMPVRLLAELKMLEAKRLSKGESNSVSSFVREAVEDLLKKEDEIKQYNPDPKK